MKKKAYKSFIRNIIFSLILNLHGFFNKQHRAFLDN